MPEINFAPAPQENGSTDAYRRRLLQAKLLQGQAGDASQPIYDKRAGYAKIMQGLAGGGLEILADNREAADQKATSDLIAQYYTGGSTPSVAPTPAAAASPMGALPGMPSGSGRSKAGKVYSNDEPSPLDPPSGEDRTRMMATILGESANQPAAGQNAVASVIRNRAVDGGYGGDNVSNVVTAKNQFEPWNTETGRAKMGEMLRNPALAQKADDAIRMAYGEGGMAPNDPTNGAKNFIEPNLQTSLGRPMPAWAKQPGQMIGDHKFIGGVPGGDQQPYDVAGPATAAPSGQPSAPPDRAAVMAQSLAPQPNAAVPDRQKALAAQLMADPRVPQAVKSAIIQQQTPSYGFQTTADGTIIRTDSRSGTVSPVYQAKPKPIEMNGRLLNPDGSVIADFSDPKTVTVGDTVYDLKTKQPLFTAKEKPAIEYMKDENGNIIGLDKTKIAPGVNVTPPGTNTPANPFAAPGKAPTEGQANSANYANRMVEAHNVINGLEKIAADPTQRALSAIPGVGNYAVSNDTQKVNQAKRDFMTAVLRRESGASISTGEFSTADKQYFPQPGDSPEVIEQKRVNRETTIKGVMAGAGHNYKPPETFKPGVAEAKGNKTSSGITWSVE